MPKYEVHLKPVWDGADGEVVEVDANIIDTEYGELRLTSNNVTVAVFANHTWEYAVEVKA